MPAPQWVRASDYPKALIHGRVHNSVVQLAAVKAGMGLSMLPCFMGDPEPGLRRMPPGPEPGLRRMPPGTTIPDRDLWLLTHEDLRGTARVKRFLDFMADAIRSKRDLLQGLCPQPPQT